MPLFEITARSTFENVYLIEADNREDAELRVNDNNDPPDFFQKHDGENIIAGTELIEGDPSENDIEIAITSIRNRGYC